MQSSSQHIQLKVESLFYALVGNIPTTFHSADLRNYFAKFIKEQRFNCFHFRHRPQSIKINATNKNEIESSNQLNSQSDNCLDPHSSSPLLTQTGDGGCAEATEAKHEGVNDADVTPIQIPSYDQTGQTPSLAPSKNESLQKFCALVRLVNAHDLQSLVKAYHGKFWMDKAGNELHGRCMVQKVRLANDEIVKFAKELRPPRFMPQGNVGTSNEYFLNLIKECKLPPSLIKKLGLEFPTARKYKKYSKVPLDYGTRVEKGDSDTDDVEVVTGKGHALSHFTIPKLITDASTKEGRKGEPSSPQEEDTEIHANDDDDNCEEWERHEALHNDVTSQERSKERLYEEEIELVWEKGGSGLLFYTDAQYWDEQEGGFDEKTADDLDIDMEGYYEEGGGDKDARDMLEMRTSERFKKGLETISVFKRRRSPSPTPCSSSSYTSPHAPAKKIGEFEVHTKGVGRKLMEQQGWREGRGLGATRNVGIAEALESEGQDSRDRRGLGYYGEKLVFGGKSKRPKHSNANNPYGLDEDDRVVIGTIYDKPAALDKNEPLMRSNAPTFIKRYDFVKPKKL